MFWHELRLIPIQQTYGWSNENGKGRVWWRAKLEHSSKVRFANFSGDGEHEVQVDLVIGTASPEGKIIYNSKDGPVLRSGYLAISSGASEVSAHLAVPALTMDMIISTLNVLSPPEITVGFGPESVKKVPDADYRLIGIPSDEGEDTDDLTVPLTTCRFTQIRRVEPTGVPEIDNPPRFMSVSGIAFAVISQLFTVAIAATVLGKGESKFELAVISLLLLIYVTVQGSKVELAQLLGKMEIAALSRFLQLKTLGGFPAEPSMSDYVRKLNEKIERPAAKTFIGLFGLSIIWLMVAYQLFKLLLS
jgi:hypothetical protein